MSTISFLTMQQEVAGFCKMNLNDAAQAAMIKRWINFSQEDINSRANWPWTEGREVVQTVVEKTAGTVSVVAAGTTVTGSGTAFASTDEGSFIQFSSSNDWYKISTVSASDSLVIEKPYTGTADLSAGTYKIRKVYYSLSSAADKVLTIRQSISPIKLNLVHYRDFDMYQPDVTATGTPEICTMFGQDSSRNHQFFLYPIPDAAINIEFRTKLKSTDLVANDDIPTMPEKWAKTVLLAGAIWRGMEFNRTNREDVRADKWLNIFEVGILRMMADETVSSDRHGMVRSIETGTPAHEIPMPENYGS